MARKESMMMPLQRLLIQTATIYQACLAKRHRMDPFSINVCKHTQPQQNQPRHKHLPQAKLDSVMERISKMQHFQAKVHFSQDRAKKLQENVDKDTKKSDGLGRLLIRDLQTGIQAPGGKEAGNSHLIHCGLISCTRSKDTKKPTLRHARSDHSFAQCCPSFGVMHDAACEHA